MNAATTLAAYGAALAVVLGAAVGVGQAVGPVGTTARPAHGGDHSGDHSGDHAGDPADRHGGDDGGAAAEDVAGLAVTQDGHTLVLDAAPRTAGRPGTLAFRVLGPDGQPVTRYAQEHERDLHLVVVRRDGTAFQHLHPERDAAGRWSTPLTLPTGGTYKVFADTRPQGARDGLVLATDVTVPGTVPAPAAPPAEQRTAVVDGYTVTLEGDLVAGRTSPLTLRVARDGRPVTDLEPYLGASGHVVALREGDLAYLHVHPAAGAPDGGPEVVVAAEVPSPGRYRLFLEFRHAGVVRTAAFTTTAGPAGAAASPAQHASEHGH